MVDTLTPPRITLEDALFGRTDLAAHAVIDGAAHPDLPALLDESGARHECLFDWALDPEVAAVAPYLVALTPGSPVTAALLAARGRNMAVFALSAAPFLVLRRHCRALVTARLPDGREVYFRFYDPRVMRSVMPLMTAAQNRLFFGQTVTAWLCEGEGGEGLVRFDRP